MILNIVDDRDSVHRWKKVTAIVEPTWHDNRCKDADQAEPCNGESDYEERDGISVAEAIEWANFLPDDVTLYLSDSGDPGRWCRGGRTKPSG